MKKHYILLFFYLTSSFYAISQQQRMAGFGFFYEPIIPLEMFRISKSEVFRDNVLFTSTPLSGYTLGTHLMVELNKHFTIESGINYVTRNFHMSVKDGNFDDEFIFQADNFEIPITATYFVRLSERLFMGHTLGISLQLIPSDLYTRNSERDERGVLLYSFEQFSNRKSPIYPTFKGSFGFEYRTKENGYFFIGPVYHLFSELYNTSINYYHKANNKSINRVLIKSVGDYFGIQVRYIFKPKSLIRSKFKLPDYGE